MGLALAGEPHTWCFEAGSQSVLSWGGFQGAPPDSAILPLILGVLSVLSLR